MQREPWCPVAFTARTFSGKWKPTILLHLHARPCRFGELKRLIPGISPRALVMQLTALEKDGLVARDDKSADAMLHVEYRLTERAETLGPILDAMTHWGEQHRPAESERSPV